MSISFLYKYYTAVDNVFSFFKFIISDVCVILWNIIYFVIFCFKDITAADIWSAIIKMYNNLFLDEFYQFIESLKFLNVIIYDVFNNGFREIYYYYKFFAIGEFFFLLIIFTTMMFFCWFLLSYVFLIYSIRVRKMFRYLTCWIFGLLWTFILVYFQVLEIFIILNFLFFFKIIFSFSDLNTYIIFLSLTILLFLCYFIYTFYYIVFLFVFICH